MQINLRNEDLSQWLKDSFWPLDVTLRTVFLLSCSYILWDEGSTPIRSRQCTALDKMYFKGFFVLSIVCQLYIGSDGLKSDVSFKQCSESFSSVTLTSTRLLFSTVHHTVTLVDAKSTQVSLTTTACASYTVTHTETVSEYQVPELAVITDYATILNIIGKNVAYTRVNYKPQTITITYSATDVANEINQVLTTTASALVSTVTVWDTVTNLVTETVMQVLPDITTSLKYVPVYLTQTMTNTWPVYQTVYQTKYNKQTIDHAITVVKTSTIYHCWKVLINYILYFCHSLSLAKKNIFRSIK